MEVVSQDTGLQCLALLLRFHQVAVDPTQIAHQFPGAPIGVSEMLRCARQFKLKERSVSEAWAGLARLSLPAIIERRDGTFAIIGKVGAEDALIHDPAVNRPQVVKRAEFEESWTGRIVLMTRRASLSDLARKFDVLAPKNVLRLVCGEATMRLP